MKYDVIVVGAGLAGLTVAYKLALKKKKVLLLDKERFVGGRTSSFNDKQMNVEAGFHRHIGYYKELPKLLKEVNVNLNDIIMWEMDSEIRIGKNKKFYMGIAPFYAPYTFLKSIIGNNDYLNIKDKLSLSKFFILGFIDYKIHPKKLDEYSILAYAKKHKVTTNTINYIIKPLSTGIFFLPCESYSAKLFFGLFYPALFSLPKLRVGAYKGGMSEVLAKPILNEFIKYNGKVMLNTKVESLVTKDKQVVGIELDNKKKIYAKNIVLATDIFNTKKIISSLKDSKFKNTILRIPTTSAISVQIELSKPLMKKDRVTFTPNSDIASFTEESHSTFKDSKGRVSIILANPDKFLKNNDDEIFKIVCSSLLKLGLDIKDLVLDYRVIRHEHKFYNLAFNNDKYRPHQKTKIKGLVLAGDYTRQKLYAVKIVEDNL